MSRHDDSVRMRHMLDYAREAVAMVTGRSRQDLDADRMLQLAVAHLVEIVGEAGSRVSSEARARYPDIPWHEAIGARNRIVHGYFQIDYDIVWQIVTAEFPLLIAALERALPGHVG